MVNAQEWLEKKCPPWEEGIYRSWMREIYVDEEDLEGELDLAEFKNLEKIYIPHYVDEEKLKNRLEIKNKREGVEITKLAYAVNAQEWLNKNFSQEERKDVKWLDLTNLNLEGDLDLEGFAYGDGNYPLRLYITGNPRLGKIKNKREGVRIHIDAQEWLSRKYPNKKEVKKIESKWDKIISGELILTDFPQLEEIRLCSPKLIKLQINNCSQLNRLNCDGSGSGRLNELTINNCPELTELNCCNNGLNELTINNCPNLQNITAYNNRLTNLDLKGTFNLKGLTCFSSSLNNLDLSDSHKLKYLDIRDNNFSSDLSFLSHLVNLESLEARDNHFTGSLKPLKNLTKLERLIIYGSDVSHGLEYLPKSVKSFGYSFSEGSEVKVSEIQKELAPYNGNIQAWKWATYPKEERKNVKKLDISEGNLEGELDLSDFTSLETFDCSSNKLTRINLDNNKNLTKFNCSNNNLNNLDISNLIELKWLNCSNNHLTNIIYPSNSEKLTHLDIKNNNLSEQDLSVFNRFINLETLRIGTDKQEKNSQGIYNHFTGSLESLKNLTKLVYLDINNTDIDSGLECLPASLEEISCDTENRMDAHCQKLQYQLKGYELSRGEYSFFMKNNNRYQDWRNDYFFMSTRDNRYRYQDWRNDYFIKKEKLEKLQKEEKHFQKQIERLEKQLTKANDSQRTQYENKLQEIKVELKDRQTKIEQQLTLKPEAEKFVAQIESKK